MIGDRLIPLAPSSLVGFFHVGPTKSFTFSPGDLRVAIFLGIFVWLEVS